MSVDRMNIQSTPARLPNAASPKPALSENSAALSAGAIAAGGQGLADSFAGKTLGQSWTDKAGLLSVRELAERSINRMIPVTTHQVAQTADDLFGAPPPNQAAESVRFASAASALDHLAPKNYDLLLKNRQAFFEGLTPSKFVKEGIIQRNWEPVKDLTSGKPQNLGGSLLHTVGLAWMGFDVLKNTKKAYEHAHAQEDGSVESKLNTVKETATAFGKYGLRNGITWEAASLGLAIGRVLPIGGPASVVASIGIGALLSAATHKKMDQVLKTGEADPVQQGSSAHQPKTTSASKTVSSNPFHTELAKTSA